MGIKNLNRYLKKYCKCGIKNIQIGDMKNKTIVIDTSIYLYKYLEKRTLLESFFVMITQFISNKMTPLFIFDGKPDESKMELLLKRIKKKQDALKQLKELKIQYNNNPDIEESEKETIMQKMEECRKRATRVKETDIVALKKLFDAMGVYYYDAPMEADVVCAYFVKSGLAWACMSDDMDMFVYGCKRVLREWRIDKKCGVLYDTNKIIVEMNIDPNYFSPLLMLLGTDYHQELCKDEQIRVNTAFQWYDEFIQSNPDPNTNNHMVCFYSWLCSTNKITHDNMQKVFTISSMYDVSDNMDVPAIGTKKMMHWNILRQMMAPYGFLIRGT